MLEEILRWPEEEAENEIEKVRAEMPRLKKAAVYFGIQSEDECVLSELAKRYHAKSVEYENTKRDYRKRAKAFFNTFAVANAKMCPSRVCEIEGIRVSELQRKKEQLNVDLCVLQVAHAKMKYDIKDAKVAERMEQYKRQEESANSDDIAQMAR